MSKYTLADSMNIRPEHIGGEITLVPFAQHIASQRGSMFASHVRQSMIVEGAEFPIIFTGFEHKYKEHTFDKLDLQEPVMIKAIIPKFNKDLEANPETLIVYVGLKSHTIGGYFIRDYRYINQRFGYELNITNEIPLIVGTIVEPGQQFVRSRSHNGEMYCSGVNGNVVYGSFLDATNDAISISESFAKKLAHVRICKLKLLLSEHDLPINVHGTPEDYLPIPQLGASLNQNLLLVLRTLSSSNGYIDVTDTALNRINSTDSQYVIPPHSTLIDMDIMFGHLFKAYHKQSLLYKQFVHYQEQIIAYYMHILTVYYELIKEGYTVDNFMNSLITRALMFIALESRRSKLRWKTKELANTIYELLNGPGRRQFKLYQGKVPVPFIKMNLYYKYTEQVNNGYKLTGQDGSKGVISKIVIRPDAEMIVDQHGVRADVVQSIVSIPNRNIPAAFYKQFIGRIASDIETKIKQSTDYHNSYLEVMEFFNIVSPEFAQIVANRCNTPDKESELIKDIQLRGIHVCIPPFSKHSSVEMVKQLRKRYGDIKTPVSFVVTHKDGTKEIVTTEQPILIGKVFFMLLEKIPTDSISAISAGYINRFGLPIRPEKKRLPLLETAIRFGEAEHSILGMSSPPDADARLMGLQGTSPLSFLKLMKELLTSPHPTQLEQVDLTTKQIVETANNVNIFNHCLGVSGIKLTEEDT